MHPAPSDQVGLASEHASAPPSPSSPRIAVNIRTDTVIAVWIGPLVVKELKRIVEASEIIKEDDSNWPKKNIVGKQELEIRLGNDHISFEVRLEVVFNAPWIS